VTGIWEGGDLGDWWGEGEEAVLDRRPDVLTGLDPDDKLPTCRLPSKKGRSSAAKATPAYRAVI
jgi:hypothetical protein